MSYTLEAVRSAPVGLWPLDNPAPFIDYSGYSMSGTAASTPATCASLMGHAAFASVFDNTRSAQFQCPVFQQNREAQSFTLSCIVRPNSNNTMTNPVQILSHNNTFDGLSIKGTVVSFTTQYLNTGSATCTFDLQVPRTAMIVGVHNVNKNALYVDGQLVSEVAINELQQADTYITTDGYLYSGKTAGANSIALNGVAVFPKELDGKAVYGLYREAIPDIDPESVTERFGGFAVSLSQDPTDIFLEQDWATSEDWNTGMLNQVAVENDQLIPSLINNATVYGEWLTVFPLDTTDAVNIYSVSAMWSGNNADVSASLDGQTWVGVTRGRNISLITPGFNPNGAHLQIKVAFAAGVPIDSFVDNLNIVGLKTGATKPIAGRTVTSTYPAYVKKEYPTMTFREDWGTQLANGSVTISASNAEPTESVGTREYWVKRNDAGSVSFSPTANTVYINGVPGSVSNLRVGEWALIHLVSASPFNSDMMVSGNVSVGRAGMYDTVLTANQIQTIYKAYTAQDAVRVGDNSDIVVTQSTIAAKMYEHDWAIESTG